MSRILVCAIPALGHINPMLMAAEYLRERGHHVIFNTSEGCRERVLALGLSFEPHLDNANFDHNDWSESFPELKKIEPGPDQTNFYIKYLLGDSIPAQYRCIRKIIKSESIDLVLTDMLFMGTFPFLLGPREARPPMIACGVVGSALRDVAYSPFTGPDATKEGRKQIAEDNRLFNEALRPGNKHLDRVIEGLGVPSPGEIFYDRLYTLPDVFLQFSAEDFEYPMENKPKNFHFAGPILPKETVTEPPAWMKKLDRSRPVVFVTQGTLASCDVDELINPALKALADEDVEVVVTSGGGDVEQILRTPNATVESYIPYGPMLKKTDVFLTNGGLDGVQQALSLGVPVIAGGDKEDRPRVCARLAWTGAGINLKTGSPTPEQIRAAVREMLGDPRYRERAKKMKESLSRYDALKTVAMAVEAAIAEDAPRKARVRPSSR
ncbi:nucleotide disphospho-sugar-binding domain-containing protein [Granulicella sp. dw_53]|uniref:glycosyltransferase n=1 Tax=Granulicella sp. dw_53 TaxID=2719792 RepID=UPI001BD2629F|nr:nucleotide disphospho-sugar-binding domain-containing protein [Granulicella sp. dw_53]